MAAVQDTGFLSSAALCSDEKLSSARFAITPTPSWEIFKEREAYLAGIDLSGVPVPVEFPKKIVLPSLWNPQELDLADVTLNLSATDVEELESALGDFQSRCWLFSLGHQQKVTDVSQIDALI